MELNEIKILLEKIAPTAYREFGKGQAKAPPFICYFVDNEAFSGADDKNYVKQVLLIVDLYTDEKDPATEARIDALFNGYEFEKYEAWIEDVKLLQVAYHVPITEKL